MSSTVAGALVGGALDAFGSKPVVPELPLIDPRLIQLGTIGDNLQMMPGLQELGGAVNRFMAQQTRAALDMQLPGLTQQAIDLTGAQLRGELTSPQLNFLSDRAAARAQTLGVGGGGFQLNLERMGLVEASLGRQQQGLSNFGALAQRLVPPQFDVTSMFFSPQQRLSFAMQDRAARFQRDLLNAQVLAAPDPADVALAEGFDQFFETWKNIGLASMGGIGGMGGMTGAGGSPSMNSAGMGIG